MISPSLVVLLLAFAVPAAPPAGPPTHAEIDRIIASYETRLNDLDAPKTAALRGALADDVLLDLDPAGLSFMQIERLFDESEICAYTSRRGEFDRRLAELGAAPNDAGARALIRRLDLFSEDEQEDRRSVIEAMLAHPALSNALRDPALWSTFMVFEWYVLPREIRGLEPQLVALGLQLPEKTPILGVLGAVDIFKCVSAADPGGFDRREPLRVGVVNALRDLLTYVDPDDPELQKWNFAHDMLGHIKNQIERLEGPAVRGRLVGSPAPQIEFAWVSGDRKLKSLSELRGKVVVLDFWATWCGPCIGSFPNVRQLVERYEGKPVEFIGVTAIQGAHYELGDRTDCKGDPEREMALMTGFIEALDITWTVAFSTRIVFDPLYDVDGIPHVVIIDTKGVVRDRGLHPFNDEVREIELIDTLLHEAGVEPPPAPKSELEPAEADRARDRQEDG